MHYSTEGLGQKALRARAILARANTRLVISIAKHYQGRVPLEDLIQSGNEGLMKAVDKFDPERGNRFSTHATWWIRNEVSRYVPEAGYDYGVSDLVHGNVLKLTAKSIQLTHLLGHVPSIQDLSDAMNLDAEKIHELINAARKARSLEAPVHDDDGYALGDVIAAPEAESVEDQALDAILQEKLYDAIHHIDPLSQAVLLYLYGFEDGIQKTKKEACKRFGYSAKAMNTVIDTAESALQNIMITIQSDMVQR